MIVALPFLPFSTLFVSNWSGPIGLQGPIETLRAMSKLNNGFPDHSPQDSSPQDNSPHQNSPHQNSPHDNSPHDISHHGHFTPRTFRPTNISPHGHFAPRTSPPRTFRPTDISPHGQLAPLLRTKKIVNFNFKTHNSLTSKEKLGVVSHICIYKINNLSKNVHILKPILPLVCLKGTDRKKVMD